MYDNTGMLWTKCLVTLLKSCRHAVQAHANTGKLIENPISQALTRPQDVMPPNSTIDSRTFGTNHTSHSSYEANWTMPWQTTELLHATAI